MMSSVFFSLGFALIGEFFFPLEFHESQSTHEFQVSPLSCAPMLKASTAHGLLLKLLRQEIGMAWHPMVRENF